MLRYNDYCREYKNGNITIKLDSEAIKEMKTDEMLFISECIGWLDCVFYGETFCLNNWETGHMIYNYYSDLCYIFPWRYLEDLKEGKTVRLYARKPDQDDIEYLKEEGLIDEI